MNHSIDVHLGANIDKYKAGMDAAKKMGTDSLGFIATIFDKIKGMFGGLWDSFKSFFSGLGDKFKSFFGSMSDSASSAFSKIAGYFKGSHADIDATGAKMAETDEKSSSLAKTIGITLVAAFVAVTAAAGVMVKQGLNVDATYAGIATSTNIAVSQISRFEGAAARSGMSIKDLGDSVGKFREAMAKAAAGDGSDEFAKLGVKVTDANGALRQTDDVLIETSKKIAAMSSEADKYDAAAKVAFGGKVQFLEDTAHAGTLVARVSDDQAAAAVRLGKIWHEILPAGQSMWSEISDKLTNSLTPAMTDASVSILESKNRIVDAFSQIYGGGSLLDKLGDKIREWSKSASTWFAGVEKSTTNMTIGIMRFIAAKTGFGNADAYKDNGGGYVPAQTPLTSEKKDPVTAAAEKEATKQYDQLTDAIKAKIAAQQLEAQTGAVLTDGQRTQLQMMALLKDSNLKLSSEEELELAARIKQLGDLEKSNKAMLDGQAAAEAAAKKEGEAYASLTAGIQAKIDENKLQLQVTDTLSESQKLAIKLDADLASGKLKLAPAHLATAQAMIVELAATEQLVKAQQAEKDGMAWMQQSAQARNASTAALEVEYAMYGQNTDARDIAMIAVKAETDLEKFLAEERKKGIDIGAQLEAQLRAEKDMRVEVEQATLAQTKALQYATQLAEENKNFGIGYIVDDKQRAAAQLALDSQVWRQRIQLAGDGTEAQQRLQEQFDTWYKNQSIKPALDEQKQMWGSIESTAHDTFVSIFDSGKSALDRLRDVLKNGLLDLLYQMTIKKWIIQIQASATGNALAGAGSTGGTGDMFASAASSSANPLVQAVGMATSLYKSISGMSGSMVASLGKGVASLGDAFGSSAVSSFGKGMQGFGLDGTLGAAGGYGQMAGAVLTRAGNVAAGYALGSTANNLISGQYSTGSGLMSVEKVATAVASYFGPQFGALAGAISGLVNHAFGMGPTEIKAQGLRGTYAAGQVSGQTYQDYHQDGGWFRSDKDWDKTQDLTATMQSQLVQAFTAIQDGGSAAAKALGLDADALAGYRKSIDIAFTGDATKDAQAVTDFFKGVSDEVANKLVPDLASFSQSGETASDTLNRLVSEFTATTTAAQNLGKTAAELFGSDGLGSAAVRERLVQLAGGADSLVSLTSAYAQNFMTTDEKIAPVVKALDKAFTDLGQGIPQTIAQYKALVSSIDPTTEAGAKLLVSVLQLGDAFTLVHGTADDAAAAIEKALSDSMDAALKGVQRAVDAQKDVLKNAYDQVAEGLDKAITKTKDSISSLTDLSKALHDAVSSAAGVSMSRAEGQAQVQAALAIAKAGGPLPTADSLKNALSAVTADSKDQFSTFEAYQRDRLQTAISISQLAGVTDDQLSTANRQLAVLQATKDAAQAAYDAEVKRLDSIVDVAQRQIDAVKGVDVSVQSVTAAVNALQAILAASQGGSTAAIVGAYGNALGRAPDAAGLAWWQQQAAAGVSPADMTKAIGSSAEAASKIEQLYQTVLGRTADAAGLAFWQSQLGNGLSLGDVESAIRSSDEEHANLTTVAPMASTTSTTIPPVTAADVAKIVSDALQQPLEKIASYTQRTAKGVEDQNLGNTVVDFNKATA